MWRNTSNMGCMKSVNENSFREVNARMSPMKLWTHHGRRGEAIRSCRQRNGGSEICLWVSWTGCQHRLTLGISKTEIWRASSVGDIQCFKRLSRSRFYLQSMHLYKHYLHLTSSAGRKWHSTEQGNALRLVVTSRVKDNL